MSGEKKRKQPFWLGGVAACMAATCTHPLDQTKYRMQVMTKPPNILSTLIMFAKRDGIPRLWTGLTGSWLRQSTYSTARFGLYNTFSERIKQSTGNSKLTSYWEVLCSGAAGGLAGLIGNPTEVVLVRMCADAAKDPKDRYNYRNSIQALGRIGSSEGGSVFLRGLTPNIVRSVLMNISQIATYAGVKRQLLESPTLGLHDGIGTHFLASLIAGTVATTVCAPADVLKSRIQNAASKDGVKPSLKTIIAESYQKEGLPFLMRGWTPAWLRLAPNTVLTFVFLEQLQKLIGVQ